MTNLQAAKVIDAKGGYITPGGIDGHVHLEQDTYKSAVGDRFLPGTKSGICGGTTSIVCFAVQQKDETDIVESVKKYHECVSQLVTTLFLF